MIYYFLQQPARTYIDLQIQIVEILAIDFLNVRKLHRPCGCACASNNADSFTYCKPYCGETIQL